MGTNFYTYKNGKRDKHIGKSSGGWCFSLHVYEDIKDLADWEAYFDREDISIRDEYEKPLTKQEFLEGYVTCDRTYYGNPPRRHRSEFCVGWGEGHWDYIYNDFE